MFQMFLRCTCEEMCTNGTFLMGMVHGAYGALAQHSSSWFWILITERLALRNSP